MNRVVRVSPSYIRRLIAEEKAVLAEHVRHKEIIISEAYRLKREGYSNQYINEGLMDIIKSLGGGFIQTFKYDITLWLLEKLGMDREGFLARVISNVVEEADIMDFKKYFSPGGCQQLANLIMDAAAETGIEPLVDGFVKGLGINPDSRIYASVREAVAKSILDGDLAQGLQDKLSDLFCNFNPGDILDVFRGSTTGGSPAAGGEQLGLFDNIGSLFGGSSEPAQAE